jgi:hypothetical protein
MDVGIFLHWRARSCKMGPEAHLRDERAAHQKRRNAGRHDPEFLDALL